MLLSCCWRSSPKSSEVTGTFVEQSAAYSFLRLGFIASRLFSDNSYCEWPNNAISSRSIFLASFSRALSKFSVHFAMIVSSLARMFWVFDALRSTRLAVWPMFAHISGFTRGATRLLRSPGRECFFNFSVSLSEVSFSDHLLLTSFASLSDTSWSVCSAAFRSFAIVSSRSSFNSRVGLLFSPF